MYSEVEGRGRVGVARGGRREYYEVGDHGNTRLRGIYVFPSPCQCHHRGEHGQGAQRR